MKSFRFFAITITALLMSAGLTSNACAKINKQASVVYLRNSCSSLNDCFTDMPALNTWIWNTRKPNASNPLLVNIGPGTFQGSFGCSNSGYVTLNGSGMGSTVLENSSGPISSSYCTELHFSDMTVRNTGNLFGIGWIGGGKSTWSNVEADMIGYGWFEGSGQGCAWTPGEHYWFNSRISVKIAAATATAYYATCDVSWFFGSELSSIADKSPASTVIPLHVPGGELHVYGSVIRSVSQAGITTGNHLAVQATAGGQVHIHGTGIDVISEEGNDIAALQAAGGASIHANQSSYVLQTGAGGVVTRIVNSGGTVKAPYLWEENATPPDIVSVNGSDMAVVTSTADFQPHLVIYSENCASAWFDTVTGSCY